MVLGAALQPLPACGTDDACADTTSLVRRSVMSLHLCTKLRALADAKTCTIVTTIHQPQAKIYE